MVLTYGLDYIDEAIAYHDDSDERHYLLQDASYNVIAVTNGEGDVVQQYSYKPYGHLFAAESIENGAVTDDIDPDLEPELLLITKGHQGLHHLPEIGAIHNRNRNRILKPRIGGTWRKLPYATLRIRSAPPHP